MTYKIVIKQDPQGDDINIFSLTFNAEELNLTFLEKLINKIKTNVQ